MRRARQTGRERQIVGPDLRPQDRPWQTNIGRKKALLFSVIAFTGPVSKVVVTAPP